MSSKPESTFIASVHRHLPLSLYHMKTHNAYISGPADVWYSGNEADIWVEYKYTPKLPELVNLADHKKKYACTALQLEWLNARHDEGRRVFVILGFKDGGVIFANRQWNLPRDTNAMIHFPRKELAEWISNETTGLYDVPPKSRKRVERCV